MGRRIWVIVRLDTLSPWSYDTRVLSFKQFLPAGPTENGRRRDKHLVQLWTDLGMRTLSVGSIRLKDPRRTGEVPRTTSETPAAS